MVLCCRLEHKDLPELGSNPEDRAEFDQRDHDEVEERRAIELAAIETREVAAAERVPSRDGPAA